MTSQTFSADSKLVNRITYLSSLASSGESIDPMLDTLRQVTSRWTPSTPLPANDRARLEQLEAKLKDYLISSDPLRSFTQQSLEERLHRKEKGQRVTFRSFWMVLLLSVATGLAAFATLFNVEPLTTRALVSVPFFYAALHVSIAWFYLSSLQDFRKEFKRAAIYLGLGIIFIASSAQFALYTLLGIEEAPLLQYAGLPGLISLGVILMYLWLRQYARLLGVKTVATSLPLAALGSAVVILVAVAAPHTNVAHELYFDVSLASILLMSVFAALSFIVSGAIMNKVTPAYAAGLKWLHVYFMLIIPTPVFAAVALAFLGELHGTTLNIVMCAAIPQQIMLLYTGYLFKKNLSA